MTRSTIQLTVVNVSPPTAMRLDPDAPSSFAGFPGVK